ncbi:hypothetical protein DVDV_0490 [Desulfovibrio sp. DV]|nr:hypothetical protein DVDV_0490 [Desulfovibrio sp. DV]
MGSGLFCLDEKSESKRFKESYISIASARQSEDGIGGEYCGPVKKK